MDDYIQLSKYRVSGYGAFEKLWFRAEVHHADGSYGIGVGASREAAIKRALKDSVKDGGRSRDIGAGVLGTDSAGRLTCHNKDGHRFVLDNGRWVRVSN